MKSGDSAPELHWGPTFCTDLYIPTDYIVIVWPSSNGDCRINEITLCRAEMADR